MSLAALPNELIIRICERLPRRDAIEGAKPMGRAQLWEVASLRLAGKRFGFLQNLWYLVCTENYDNYGTTLFTSVGLAGRREGPQYWLVHGCCSSFEYRGYRTYKDDKCTHSLRTCAHGYRVGHEVDGAKYFDNLDVDDPDASDAFDALVAGAYAQFAPPGALAAFLRTPETKAFHTSPERFPEPRYDPDPALVRRLAAASFYCDPDPVSGDTGREGASGPARAWPGENGGELYVQYRLAFDPQFQRDEIMLVFTAARGDDDEAADVSFLLGRGALPPCEGLVAQEGEPLRFGDTDDAVDRWPGPGDWFWSWDALRGAARAAQVPEHPYGVFFGEDAGGGDPDGGIDEEEHASSDAEAPGDPAFPVLIGGPADDPGYTSDSGTGDELPDALGGLADDG
jgi:hypothetical protein